MDVEQLKQAVESLRPRLTATFIEAQVRELMRQGEDVGGGVNAFRLVRHLLKARRSATSRSGGPTNA